LHVPGACYHVILRGNHRESLFGTTEDRVALNEIVADVLARFDARIHAYCWMTNHLHALLQIAEPPLAKIMQRIAMRYSRHRHVVLRTTGHLFERRYKARVVNVDAYFLALLRYIHLNPVKAGIVTDPAAYPWSSHRAYLGRERVPWLSIDFGLSLFAADRAQARDAYQRFLALPTDDADVEPEPDRKGGARILATDQYVTRIDAPVYQPRCQLTLEQLAQCICTDRGVAIELVRSRSSQRMLTTIRLQIAREALTQRVATLTEVARFLQRDPSTLCKLLANHHPKLQ
jgi:REP element-mobilizing transposase RayT